MYPFNVLIVYRLNLRFNFELFMLTLPPELWVCIFEHAAHIPGTLVPDIYAYTSSIGFRTYTKTCRARPRDALVTKRTLVRVCKQWWHLAIPILYRYVYIGRARFLSLSLARSVAETGPLSATRPLGEYTQRLDIAIRDHAENPKAELDSLASLITHMPNLAIVSFTLSNSYFGCYYHLNGILDALHRCATSLRVFDWSSLSEPSVDRTMDLLAKCTQLRILHCPRLLLSKKFKYAFIPPTVTSLCFRFSCFDDCIDYSGPIPSSHSGPSALHEIILDWNNCHWEDLLQMYGPQLVSLQLYLSSPHPVGIGNIGGQFRLLKKICPDLRSLTITSEFPFFIHSQLVFPFIAYLGLREARPQTPKRDFKLLFIFLKELWSSVPSLRVVRLLNEHQVHCLLNRHTKLAVRALRPFMDAAPFRVEDQEGVLLTGLRSLIPVSYLD